MAPKQHFRGNQALKGKNVQIEWTAEMLQEYVKCKEDIYYFIEHYFRIVTEDGPVIMKLRDYQKEMIDAMVNGRFTMAVMARQSGKTECFRAFLIHYILFNDYKTVAIVANKESTAMEVIGKLQISYQLLPTWLQLGIIEFNKGSFILENQSRLFASATSKDALRGFTCQIIVVDEAAHIDNWDEFYGAVAPTISAGKATKLIMASTPNGLNHFYEFYEGSSLGKNTNGFHAIFVRWDSVPGRDEQWKQDTLRVLNHNEVQFDQEYNCSFIGSAGTLIAGYRLETLKSGVRQPIHEMDNLKFYEMPIKEVKEWKEDNESVIVQRGIYDPPERIQGDKTLKEITIPAHKYVLVADVSRGKGLDYSAFSIFDITSLPYSQVATYRCNDITPTDYTEIIYKSAKFYNNAIVLPEINDIGEQVGSLLIDAYEYENLLCTASNGRAGKKISFIANKADKGIRTTVTVKNSGCLLLKLMLEQEKLLVWDEDTIRELLVFIKDKNSYKAEKGKHDDLAMTLVLFSWLTDQEYFKETMEMNVMTQFGEKSLKQIEDNLLSFGYINSDGRIEGVGSYSFMKNMNLPFSPFRDSLEGQVKSLTDNPDVIYMANF